ncbi:Pupal cuticle protein 20 [Orchesella cincta]|uniref:Pupal cuticle protein 20 n=1 Tax=Orchesella cincta TaxID=48709 RepID=A0A1D2M446_ORCCI|nr:Pupal cuticle protein 20 [Orchesella cincta]
MEPLLSGKSPSPPSAMIIRGSLSDSLSYTTGNGISVVDNTQAVKDVVAGSYSFTTPEGQQISTTWVADENGFRPRVPICHDQLRCR